MAKKSKNQRARLDQRKQLNNNRASQLLDSLLRRTGVQDSTPEDSHHIPQHKRLVIEALEPRLLLSADLIGSIDSSSLDRDFLPTEPASISVLITNQGDAPATPVTVKLFASSDSQLDAGDTLIGTATSSSPELLPGTSTTLDVPVSVGALDIGSYQLIASADPDQEIAEEDENNNIFLAERALNIARQFGQVPGHALPTSLSVNDTNGTAVTFSLSGPGWGEVTRSGAGLALSLFSTDTTSALTVTTSGSHSLLTGLAVDGNIKSILASNLDLLGTARISGSIQNITLGDVKGTSSLLVQGTGSGMAFSAGSVRSLVLTSATPINTVAVQEWLASGSAPASINGPSLGTLTATGEFSADINLSGAPATSYTLVNAQIGGAISGGSWIVLGRAGQIVAQSTDASWKAAFAAPLSLFSTRGTASGQLSTPSLQMLQVGGNLEQARIIVGANLGSDGGLGGTGSAADQFASGLLGRLRVTGSVIDSHVWVGIDPGNGIFDDGNDVVTGGTASRIQEIIIGGSLSSSSNIIAGSFPSLVKIEGLSVSPSTLPQLATSTIDTTKPSVKAALSNDTGRSADDHVTFDATIEGLITDANGIASLKAGFDDALLAPYSEILSDVQADGTLTLTAAQLAVINGSALTDGEHTLHLVATDKAGNTQGFDLRFILDTTAPGSPSVHLAAGDDSGSANDDNVTNINAPRIDVSAEAETAIRLYMGALLVAGIRSGPETQYQLDKLVDGAYTLNATAEDLAGNVSSASPALQLTVDTTAPSVPTLALAQQSDTGTVGDNTTTNEIVVLTGSTSPGARVDLVQAALNTVADSQGAFSFTGVALTLGDNDFTVRATDVAGNSSEFSQKITRTEIPSGGDTVLPQLNAALVNDTGFSATDGITSNGSIIGTVSDNVGLTSLLAGFDAMPPEQYQEILDSVQTDGTFNLTSAQLAAINGAPLADGAHNLHLIARDGAGNTRSLELQFVLDTAAPSTPTLGLAPESDTGTLGDNTTTNDTVVLTGSTSPGARVDLVEAALNTVADSQGAFSFSEVPLALGDNDFTARATDGAGNSSEFSQTIRRSEIPAGGDTVLPQLNAALTGDTGASATDGITSSVSISGTASDNVAVTSLLAGFDATPVAQYREIISHVSSNGQFVLDLPRLETIFGGTLTDGSHTLHLQAFDAAGNASAQIDVAFTLDTAAPIQPVFDLAVTSDSGTVGDHITNAAKVALVGTSEPGVSISVVGTSISALANNLGNFQLAGISLQDGANVLTLRAIDAAGNTSERSLTFQRTGEITQDQALFWNSKALEAIRLDVTDPPIATRLLAMVSLAIYDSLAAIDGTQAYLVKLSATGPVSADAAVAAAAHRVLTVEYPGQKGTFDAALAASLAKVAEGPAKDAGIALGTAVADTVLALRGNDGAQTFVDYPGSTELGKWRPTGPMFDVPDQPQWSTVTPFALSAANQFRPPAPPALDSSEYAQSVEEVRSVGSANSTTRTADQTEQAQFWADGMGSYTPPGHWNQIAEEIARAQGNSLSANARLFAMLNIALADAAIACWDAKYTYGLWRPETAINNADLDNNAATIKEEGWKPLLITPAHPEYVSGHSTFSAAAAGILNQVFGNDTSFSTTSYTLPGVTRSFDNFDAAAGEAGRSRVYGGIHYEFTNQAGQTLGHQVAEAVLARFALDADTQAPMVIAQDTPVALNTNLALSGQILDNLSGVVSAQYRIDGGDLKDLALDADGKFSITTAFALDGTADGSHTVTILARDAAGNLAAGFNRSFTLDTQAPALDLASLADGATLSAASRVTGTADPTGTWLVELFYTVDGGQKHSLIFDTTTGSFDQALILGNLGIGDHKLALNARDAAGNTANVIREVKVEALAPFTITRVTPTGGTGDVGVTYRPQVFFSREVNPNTLTANTFYATGPDGTKLDTTIVPALDGSFAWVFFDKPMPGGSNITLHLNGSAIRAQADGAFLDADGNGAAGGEFTWSFTSISSTVVAGTKLVGKVVDPGPDLLPMTFDDIRRGPDGVIHTPDDVFLNPIAHAKVYIIGLEDKVVYTDANGNFELTEVPVGEVKVVVDGRTATNAPEGIFFPEMVMSTQLLPGITNTVMGSMGSNEERLANADRREVYLPRVQTSALQQISQTETTVVTVDDKSAPDLTGEQRSQLTLTVPPGSAVGFDGKVLDDVKIGINTVPPELVRDMLPPGVLQHSFDITIQAPGVNTFTQPVQITFPNVFNAAPGTKLNILSFDHTTGLLVISGTGTVSADGKTVVSDEGSGVMAPGWHGMTPPGSPTNGPNPPRDPLPEEDCDELGAAKDALLDRVPAAVDSLIRNLVKNIAGLREFYTIMSESAQMATTMIEQFAEFKKQVDSGGDPSALRLGFELIKTNKDRWKAIYEAVVEQATSKNPVGLLEKTLEAAKPILEELSEACDSLVKALKEHDCPTFWVEVGCSAIDVAEFTVSNAESLLDLVRGGIKNLITKAGFEAVCIGLDAIEVALGIGDIEAQSTESGSILTSGVAFIANSSKTAVATTSDDLLAATNNTFTALLAHQRELIDSSAISIGDLESKVLNVGSTLADGIASIVGNPGNAFFLITDLRTGFELRGQTAADGTIDTMLPADSKLRVEIYDAASGRYGWAEFSSSASGTSTRIPNPLYLSASRLIDLDSDSLPDVAEKIIGTNLLDRDTDGDGILDFSELLQGLNPLGGLGIPTGVVSATTLQGTAEAVSVAGSTSDASKLTAYVATGSSGLAVVDVSRFTKPTLLAELKLSGSNKDVAVDAVRGLAAVAANEGGLHIIDVSNPVLPVLRQTITFGDFVTQVKVRDGLAYIAVGDSVAAVDLNTGDIRQTLDLGNSSGTTLTGLALEGKTLYTMDTNRTLRAISIDGDLLTLRDSLVLDAGGGKLFVGGGVAYVGTATDFTQGYSTVDVSDPADLKLISSIDAANIAGQSLAATGSGLLVTAGNLRGPRGEQIYALDVSSSNDPTNTGSFITRINLPAAPRDVVLANGLAFVADGAAGLQIVNYIGFDTKGVAPTVSIEVDGIDVDPEKAGIQVLEGRTVSVIPTVTDDVQVRNVELLVNGQVVSNDAAFPFELFAQAPTIAQSGNKLTIQVRATDTGGNATLSDPVVLDVVPDTFAPQVTKMSLDEGARVFFVRSIDVSFDEPLDLAKLNLSGIELINTGSDGVAGTADDRAIDVRLDTRSFGQSLSILPNGYLLPGTYQLRIDPSVIADKAGNALTAPIVLNFTIRPASDIRAGSGMPEITQAPSANPGQEIGLPVPFDPATARTTFNVIDASGNKTTRDVVVSRFDATQGLAYFRVPLDAVTGEIQVFSQVGSTKTTFADGTFLLQILPVIVDVQVQGVASDGSSATVVISGLGFVEGNNSEYRFGSDVVLDAGVNTGPDVYYGYVNGVYTANGQVTVTVPLSSGTFGPISIRTAGGASASYSVNLSGIAATALSGTPADADEASANPGQAVTLQGTGLSTATDVLLRWTDVNGDARMTRLSPTSAAADGSSATLVIPEYANGVASLQVFGSASQPLLQIVPKLTGFDVQSGALYLYGSGFVEGASSYGFAGATVADSRVNGGVDVYYNTDQNGRAYLDNSTLPRHGLGGLTVTTAGGTSAALDLNLLRPGSDTGAIGLLGDVAVDPVTGALWVSDNSNPGHILRIDEASGAILQTITLTDAFGAPYAFSLAGLQVLGEAINLNGTNVPQGSLLLFNGYASPDRVVAVNAANGAVIASLTLGQNYDLAAGVFDAASGHLFVTDARNSGNRIVEINAATGAEIASFAVPFTTYSYAGLTIDPVTGNLWLGTYSAAATLVEFTRTGTEVRRIDLASQGVNDSEISGLAFAPDGSLRVASSNGVVYRIDPAHDDAVQRATLTQVLASATDGVAAQSGVAAANIGQIIELRGTNFGAGTQVLFNTRDSNGNTSIVAIKPLAINDAGTRLQVLVPDLAATGEVKVVNTGASNLGFTSYNDAIYRNVTTTFTANSSTAVLRFADGGLQDINDESWGIDNVVVKQGSTTVFADTFEGGAKANWSNQITNRNALGTFSEFSGRFGNASQVLNLSGLTAGQTYTLSFDLYALDSWEGSHPTAGPDLIQITADGQQIFRETFANYYPDAQSVQTYGASSGIRLQIVPTLSGLSGRPGSDNAFNLIGSGFMEGTSTVTIGGRVFTGAAVNGVDVSGTRNDTLGVIAPRTLDGAIRVTTEGGYAEIAGSAFGTQPTVLFTGLTASANSGTVADATKASANTGQTITLTGQAFTAQTLVQFTGIDDSGALGTITRTGTPGSGGTSLSIEVPALARTGKVTVLGSNAGFDLQIVPTLKSLGGSLAPGSTVVLEGTGLVGSELTVQIDGRATGSFNVRTVFEGLGSSSADQQLLTLTVPTGVTTGIITVSTRGGTASLAGRNLSGISAIAGSGTPASSGIASANTGQTITLQGSGLQGSDRVVFTTIDSSGRLAERAIVPASVAADGNSMTVVVPVDATTGTLRLARDSSGVLLQIVPTLGDISASLNSIYNGGFLTLSGSGFAEGAIAVLFGGQRLNDSSRNTGPDVYQGYVDGKTALGYGENTTLNLIVPTNVPTGPIQVATIGGTSAAFGLSITGITASADSGTPANSTQASAVPGQTIKLQGSGLDASTDVVFETVDNNGNRSQLIVRPATVNAGGTEIQVAVPLNAVTGTVRVVGDRNASALALQILPVIVDVQVQGVASDGSSATVVISGLGFVEGNNSEYRFGSDVVLDAGVNTGPDVYYGYVNGVYTANGQVTVTVPLSSGTFGPISIRTAGGASASYSVNLSGIAATALSGTPADADEASANPGQAVTLQGTGLSTATDVLLRWTDVNGDARMTRLSPTSAAADGSSATLVIPEYANGVASLQVFGSASQPLLQIVPKLTGFDVQSGALYLYGSGFVEGASSYGFAGATVADSRVNGGVDVYYNTDQNGRAYLDNSTLPRHGLGGLTVTTAGGTSAALDLNLLRPGSDTGAIGLLGDVAVDPVTGALWVSDNSNPGHILRIDEASGAILQTITLTDAFGAPYAFSLAGLQVLGEAINLNGTNVPQGSLLLFNGYASPDRVVAVNAANGAVIASLTLGQNYDLAAGVFDAASGHLFVTDARNSGNRIVEINAATGAEIASFAVPFTTYSYAGLTIDPVTGNLWLGTYSAAATLVEFTRTGTEVRRIDLASQGVNDSEISGLAFAPDGSLRVASSNGVVYEALV
ncbi:Ig-like domain (group 3) [Nitrosospira multiformis ATCC 25196]|uniref:Ig-like domain (Group 3) n=1 Tax=Nitrosospira multiformis (strain ATCC 25196 / NCIMB 11849 / C 71) TaxID=323848 RepID=A0A1H5SEH4_NITMU|nr:Ig-like domain-containing protein [Nitrosospira multiformis]SEF48157.1 Ig-like domain (group 3) [Nitrosospira multiformis ATCC 25196]